MHPTVSRLDIDFDRQLIADDVPTRSYKLLLTTAPTRHVLDLPPVSPVIAGSLLSPQSNKCTTRTCTTST
ncbi:hypothetical protein BDW72DRAFT_185101 [Aspergillus terricola var. indicus]